MPEALGKNKGEGKDTGGHHDSILVASLDQEVSHTGLTATQTSDQADDSQDDPFCGFHLDSPLVFVSVSFTTLYLTPGNSFVKRSCKRFFGIVLTRYHADAYAQGRSESAQGREGWIRTIVLLYCADRGHGQASQLRQAALSQPSLLAKEFEVGGHW